MGLFRRNDEAKSKPVRKYNIGNRVKSREINSIVDTALRRNKEEIKKIKRSRHL